MILTADLHEHLCCSRNCSRAFRITDKVGIIIQTCLGDSSMGVCRLRAVIILFCLALVVTHLEKCFHYERCWWTSIIYMSKSKRWLRDHIIIEKRGWWGKTARYLSEVHHKQRGVLSGNKGNSDFRLRKKKIYHESGSALEKVVQRCCGIYSLGDFPYSTREGPVLPWKLTLVWAGVCSRWPGSGQPALPWCSLHWPALLRKSSLQVGPGAILVLMYRWMQEFFTNTLPGHLSDLLYVLLISEMT